jgi:hypothetical protein
MPKNSSIKNPITLSNAIADLHMRVAEHLNAVALKVIMRYLIYSETILLGWTKTKL